MSERSNISSDLLWEIVRTSKSPSKPPTNPLTQKTGHNNAYLVKSKAHGGVQFSRDPFNLTNKHSKKHAGFINDKAVSVQQNDKGGVTLMTKKSGSSHKPASHYNSHSSGKGKSGRS